MAERWQIRAPKDRWSIRQDEVQPNTPPVSAPQAPPVRPVAPYKVGSAVIQSEEVDPRPAFRQRPPSPGLTQAEQDRIDRGQVGTVRPKMTMREVRQSPVERPSPGSVAMHELGQIPIVGPLASAPLHLAGAPEPQPPQDVIYQGDGGTEKRIGTHKDILESALGQAGKDVASVRDNLLRQPFGIADAVEKSPLPDVVKGVGVAAAGLIDSPEAIMMLGGIPSFFQALKGGSAFARSVAAATEGGFAKGALAHAKDVIEDPNTSLGRKIGEGGANLLFAGGMLQGASKTVKVPEGVKAVRDAATEVGRYRAGIPDAKVDIPTDPQSRIVESFLNQVAEMTPRQIAAERRNLEQMRQDPQATPEIQAIIDRADNYLQQERTERIARNEWPEIEPTAGGVEKGGDPAAKPVRSDSPRAVEVGDVAEVYRDSDVRADANGDILVTKPGGSRLRVTQNGVTVEPGDVPDGMVATGKYIPERVTLTKIEAGILGNVEDALIQLSPEQGADAQTFLHEHWHDVQRMAPLNAVQRKALERLGNTEAQAEAYANWSILDREGRAPNVPVFRKIQRHFRELYDKVLNRPEAVFREKERTAFRGEKPEVDGPVIQSVEQARASNAGSTPAGSTPLEEVRRAEAEATPAPEALLTEPTRFTEEAARQPIVDESAAAPTVAKKETVEPSGIPGELPASPARQVSAVAETEKESAPASAPAVPPEIKPVGEVAKPEIAGLQPVEAGAAGTGQYQMRLQSEGDPTLSPSRRKTFPKSRWRQSLDPKVDERYQQNFDRLRGTMTERKQSLAEVQRLADDIAGPELAKQVAEKRWREGEVLTNVEFRAATDTHNQMLSEAVKEETALMEAKEKGTLSPEELASREFALAELNKNIAKLEEAILPMPTAMGRQLRALGMIAKQSFDTGYFLRKAAKAWGAETPNDLPERIRKPIVAAADAGQKAEQAKILEILERREQTLDPGVKDSTVKRYTDEIEGRKPKASRPTTPDERKALADDPEVKDLREKVHEARAKSKPIKTADQVLAAAIERERKRLSRQLEGEQTTASVERLTTEQRKQLFQDPVIQSLKAKIAEQRQADRIAVAARAKERELRKIDRKFAELNGEKPKVTRDQLTVEEKADLDADPEIRARRKELAHALAKAHRTSLPMWIAGVGRASMLSGVATVGRNVFGTGVWNLFFEPLATVGATGADMVAYGVRKALKGEGFRTRAIPNYAEAFKAAGTRGFKQAGEILRKGYSQEGLENLDYTAGLNLDTTNPLALGVQKAANAVLRFQTAQDRVPLRFAEAARLSEIKKLGQYEEAPGMAEKIAEDYGKELTFNANNWLSRAYNKGMMGQPEIFRAAMTLPIPFSRTPVNLATKVIESTVPGATVKIGYELAKAMQEKGYTPEVQQKLVTAVGRAAAGTFYIALGYWLEQNGLMSGAYSFTDDMKEAKEESGIMPASLKVGGKVVSLMAAAPLSILMGAGATLSEKDRRDRIQRMNGVWKAAFESAATRWLDLSFNLGKGILETPMVTGIRDIGEAAQRAKTADDFGKQLLPNYVSRFVPALFNEAGKALDDTKRNIRGKDTGDAIVKSIQGRVPVLREGLAPKVGDLGRVLPEESGLNAFNPFTTREDLSGEEVRAELLKEFKHIPDLDRLPQIEGETPHMRARRQEIIGGLRQMALAEAIAGDEYKAKQFEDDPEARIKILGDAIKKANATSKESDFLGDDYRTIPPEEKMRRLDEAYSNLVKRLQKK